MHFQRLVLGVAAAGVLCLTGAAGASLTGYIYNQGSDGNLGSIAAAVGDVNSQTPTATFTSTLINGGGYGGGDGPPTQLFWARPGMEQRSSPHRPPPTSFTAPCWTCAEH